MKNLILAAAILAGASTYATTNTTSPITPVHTVVEKGFKEVSLDKLPAAVVKSVKESFPKGKLSKAFVNENEQYKLEISLENESKTLFADKDGNWLDAKDVK